MTLKLFLKPYSKLNASFPLPPNAVIAHRFMRRVSVQLVML